VGTSQSTKLGRGTVRHKYLKPYVRYHHVRNVLLAIARISNYGDSNLIKLIVKSDLCPGDLRVLEILVSF